MSEKKKGDDDEEVEETGVDKGLDCREAALTLPPRQTAEIADSHITSP